MKRFTASALLILLLLTIATAALAAPPLPGIPAQAPWLPADWSAPPLPAVPITDALEHFTLHNFHGQVKTGPDPWFTWYFYDAGWTLPTNFQSDIWIQCGQRTGRVATDPAGRYDFRLWMPQFVDQCQMVAVTSESWHTNIYIIDLTAGTNHAQNLILHFGSEFHNPFLTTLEVEDETQ